MRAYSKGGLIEGRGLNRGFTEKELGYKKQEFVDTVRLKFGWSISDMPKSVLVVP